MSDTTVGHSAWVTDGVAAYVREARAELADLPVEDAEDLTGGMEADLSELASKSGGDLVGRLGSPTLYAAVPIPGTSSTPPTAGATFPSGLLPSPSPRWSLVRRRTPRRP